MKTVYKNDYKQLIEHLKKARKKSRLTQIELGKRLGTDQSYVSKIERLQRRLDIIELKLICEALHIDFPKFIRSFEKNLRKK